MKKNFIYPGCFAPPTFGHFQIATRAAEIFPNITIICSTNKEKEMTRWFSEEECRAMWNCYNLPKNVSVKTFTEYSLEKVKPKSIVMIRGIRNERDMEDEKRVVKLNNTLFGIDNFFYILAEKEYADISSSRARLAAQNLCLEDLNKCVPQSIAKLLLENLQLKNLACLEVQHETTIFESLFENRM